MIPSSIHRFTHSSDLPKAFAASGTVNASTYTGCSMSSVVTSFCAPDINSPLDSLLGASGCSFRYVSRADFFALSA